MGCEPHERRALRAAVEEPLEVRVELPEHERLALGVREEEQLVDERGQLRQLDVVQLAQYLGDFENFNIDDTLSENVCFGGSGAFVN